MKKELSFILILIVSLTACSKDDNGSEKPVEKTYSQKAILAEWQAMGDASPLLKEANVDCMADVDKGVSWTVSKACIGASVVGNIKKHKLIKDSLNNK